MAATQAKALEVDNLDSGWDDEDDAVDSGWDDVAARGEPAASEAAEEPEPPGLSHEERVARAAARKARSRAKETEKAQRRKERAGAAASKQKKSAPKPLPGTREKKISQPRAIAREAAADTSPSNARPIAVSATAAPARTPRGRTGIVAGVLTLVIAAAALAWYLLQR